jgi:hypothetical protein
LAVSSQQKTKSCNTEGHRAADLDRITGNHRGRLISRPFKNSDLPEAVHRQVGKVTQSYISETLLIIHGSPIPHFRFSKQNFAAFAVDKVLGCQL